MLSNKMINKIKKEEQEIYQFNFIQSGGKEFYKKSVEKLFNEDKSVVREMVVQIPVRVESYLHKYAFKQVVANAIVYRSGEIYYTTGEYWEDDIVEEYNIDQAFDTKEDLIQYFSDEFGAVFKIGNEIYTKFKSGNYSIKDVNTFKKDIEMLIENGFNVEVLKPIATKYPEGYQI